MTGADKSREAECAEGRAEGRAELVLKLLVLKVLTLKYGALSDQTEAQVRGASLEQLDRYAERVLSATSLDDVLAD